MVATKSSKRRTVKRVNNTFFGCRIDRDLVEQIRQRARDNDRTIGAEMNRVLRTALARAEKGEQR